MSSLSKAVTWKRTCRDSNPRPFGLRANALPLSHTGHQRFPQPCAVYILDVRGLVPLVSGLGLCMIWATTREMTGCILHSKHTARWIRPFAMVRACERRVDLGYTRPEMCDRLESAMTRTRQLASLIVIDFII